MPVSHLIRAVLALQRPDGLMLGQNLARALALRPVILGGLVSSTLLNVFFMPAHYLRHAGNPTCVGPAETAR